jgi:hypothetical protein
MATMEELVRTALLSMDAVTALVGSGSAAKIRSDHPDEEDAPPLVILEVDEDHLNDLDGLARRIMCAVTITCRGRTRKESRQVSEAVRVNGTDPGTGLAGYHGTVSETVLDAWLEDVVLATVSRDDGSKRRWYDVVMSFMASTAQAV